MRKDKNNRFRKIRVGLRKKLRPMLSLKVPPKDMAMSSALGMFIGMTPYVGVQMYAALLCSTLLKLPVYPLLLGTYITNVFTIPFIFAACTKLGLWIMRMETAILFDWKHISITSVFQAGKTYILPLIIGMHVAGIVLSLITYYLVYAITRSYQAKKRAKLLMQYQEVKNAFTEEDRSKKNGICVAKSAAGLKLLSADNKKS